MEIAKIQIQVYKLFVSYVLTDSLLLAGLPNGKRAKGDFRVLALGDKAEGNNSHNVEIFPIVNFGRRGGQQYTV